MKKAWFLAALLAGMVASSVHADPTYYTTLADYDAATVSNTPYTFGVAGTGTVGIVSPPFVTGPLSFSGDNLRVYSDDSYDTGNNYLSANATASKGTALQTLKADLPAAVSGVTIMDISLTGATALAFDLGTYNNADTISIEINGTYDTAITTPDGTPTSVFFGVSSPVPITSVEFGITGTEFDVLDFQVSAVPEPSTVAILGMAAGGLAAWTLRRRQRRAGPAVATV